MITVLAVDDRPDVAELTAEILLDAGFLTLVAHSGTEALEALAINEVDVLFTDIVMPNMNGVQLACQAKRIKPTLKVLLTTGYVSRDTPLIDEYGRQFPMIAKPYRPHQLVELINGLVR